MALRISNLEMAAPELDFFKYHPATSAGDTRFMPAVPITTVAIESDRITNIPIFLYTLYVFSV